jgi:multidrug efflux system membrane fusion protein
MLLLKIKLICLKGASSSLCALAIGSFLLCQTGCSKKEAIKQPMPTVPVMAEKAVVKDMPLDIRTFGNVEAFSEVPIKVMVTGPIKKIYIKPGDYVKKGDMLVQIDARSYEATLRQLQATQSRDEVIYDDAERQAAMKEGLLKRGAAAFDETKRMRAIANSTAALVESSKASVEKAKLDVEYCTIRSPIDGHVGDLINHEGAVMKANDAVIMNIVQTKPIYVSFSVPQAYLPMVQKYMALGKLYVDAKVPAEGGTREQGELTFVDNNININSGTVRMKGTFENKSGHLWPGQYVDVVLTMSVDKNRIVVPAQAVQASQEGSYVFIIRADDTIAIRPVIIERFAGKEAIIKSGINGGDTVVTDGHIRLYPEAKVKVQSSLSVVENNPAKK